ncbi:phage tail tip fiber protein [Pseudomonas sp. NY15374]|uniref:TipJ family phage tail tip protein n=1 Tax=Pseudomonas sp. NY15374 TaxID=3400357 RepID=UPI003A85EFF4
MGAALLPEVTGAKGGEKKPKNPVEAPDSLRSTNIAKILLAVGEGEFDGTPTDRDIYLDNTPIMNASGNVNFPGVKWEWRPGSIEQDYIQGIPAIENETTVNVELRSDTPFTRTLSNLQLSRVRVRFSWQRLASQDSSGNTNGYRIEYAIDVSTDGGAFVESLRSAVDGKTTNGYQRSESVNLPPATSGWAFRVRRITPNANSGTIADQMVIAGYTEIIDQKLRYPNTALLYIEFNAEQFQNIPAVTVNCKAQRWPVPSNYDPETRTYAGIWDGTFKQAWTNNPVWATYGLCVNDRFGLGKRIQPWMVDKWEMYRIAQYCDQLVPDGLGGQEPRYLCDLNLQGKAEAWTLLRDLSAIYRGMVYWAQGSLYMQADMPRAQDIDYVFTRSNVIGGDFVYGGAGRDTHYSRALVSYDNPANNYDTDVIPVTDIALQRRYRDRPVEISAIGCTRASEAQRRGKWALLSNNQDRTVSFKTGMEGANVLPGFVIPVADELVAGRPNGGRISAAAGRVVTLDRDTPIKAGDRLIINLPNGTAQGRTVQSVSGRAVTVTTAYALQPEPELQWAIDYEDLAVQLFRVLKRVRTTEGEYEFTALEFNPTKFAAIDTGAKLEERPISVIPVTTVPPPASVTLTSGYAVDQGIAVSTMTIAWPAVEGAVAYDVEWRRNNGNWIRLQRVGTTSVDVTGIYAGAYLARVRAVSAFDITSPWCDSMLTELKGKEGAPPALAFMNTTSEIFAIRLNWGFQPGADDTAYTEIQMASEPTGQNPLPLGQFAYPTPTYLHSGMAAAVVRYFRGRLVDRTGNIGPWSDWVYGQSSADSSAVLEYLDGKITESHLGQQLLSEIGKIGGDGPGSVNERFKEGDKALQVQIDSLSAQLADLAGAEEWKQDQPYLAGTLVKHDGKLYRAKVDVLAGTPVGDSGFWEYLGDYASLGEMVTALAVRVDGVETSVEEINGELTAMASRILGVEAAVSPKMAGATEGWRAGETGSHAGAWSIYSAFAQADMAIAKQVDEVKAQVGGNLARVVRTVETLTDDVSALARDNDTLTAQVGDTKAMVEDNAEALVELDGDIRATRNIKVGVDVNGVYYGAGMGVSVENTPEGMQSMIVFLANLFSVMHQPGGTPKSVFAINNGQVFMNSAIINQADIINLIITGELKSANYIPGQQGMRINFVTNEFEINGIRPGLGRMNITHQLLTVYDTARMRMRLGIWG